MDTKRIEARLSRLETPGEPGWPLVPANWRGVLALVDGADPATIDMMRVHPSVIEEWRRILSHIEAREANSGQD